MRQGTHYSYSFLSNCHSSSYKNNNDNLERISYQMSPILFSHMDILSDPRLNIFRWCTQSLQNIMVLLKFIDWILSFNQLVLKNIQHCSGVFLHYGVLPLLIKQMYSEEIFKKFFIVWFVPAFPNQNGIPWIFDPMLKKKKGHVISKASTKERDISCRLFYERLSIHTTDLEQMTHLFAWNHDTFPYEIKPAFKGTYQVIGFPESNSKRIGLPLKVYNFIQRGKIAFISFGSFYNLDKFKRNLPKLINKLTSKGYRVLVHNTLPSTDIKTDKMDVHFFKEYIEYNSLIPHCDLILFCGSIGLANVCRKYNKKMIYMPHLTEQFFWALLWKQMTNQDFLTFS
jgi:hypothetical protein